MGWMLVVSEDEGFQREAIARARPGQPIVGATGDESARALVGAIEVEQILIDALDDVGRRFLSALRSLPGSALRAIEVIVIGPDTTIPGFDAEPDIGAALALRAATRAA